jgi:hypothetical protein
MQPVKVWHAFAVARHENTGQRPPPDPALRLQYQDIHAGGCQQPRRIQA